MSFARVKNDRYYGNFDFRHRSLSHKQQHNEEEERKEQKQTVCRSRSRNKNNSIKCWAFFRRSSLLSSVRTWEPRGAKKCSLEIYVSYKALSASGHRHRQRVGLRRSRYYDVCIIKSMDACDSLSTFARTRFKRNESISVWNTGTERVSIEVHTLFASARHFFPDPILFYHCLNNVANVNRRPHVGRKLKTEWRGGQRSQIK